jgi:hypothetical protein
MPLPSTTTVPSDVDAVSNAFALAGSELDGAELDDPLLDDACGVVDEHPARADTAMTAAPM